MWNKMMSDFVMLTIVLSVFMLSKISAQDENIEPGIPFKNIPETSFSCQNRGNGYYADTETGCQIYHHCDGLGRKSSYACPNATLFQQRMLICDHWYMVKCSEAESNYGANLLIGQRNTPFVSDSEQNLRTPRPDLVSGGSDFKYKNNYSAIQNAIAGIGLQKSANRKSELLDASASSHGARPWQQQLIEATINHFESTTPLESLDQDFTEKNNGRRDVTEASRSKESGETGFSSKMNPPPVTYQLPKLLPESDAEFRKKEEERLRNLNLLNKQKSQQSSAKAQTINRVAAQSQQRPVQINQQQVKAQAAPRQQIQQQQVKSTAQIQNKSQKQQVVQQPKQQVQAPQQQRQQQQQKSQQSVSGFATTSSSANKRTTFNPDLNFKAFEHFTSPGKKATHQDYDFSRYFSSSENFKTTKAPQRRVDTFSFPKIVTTTRKPITFAPFSTTTQRPTVVTTVKPASVPQVQSVARSQVQPQQPPKLPTQLLPPRESAPVQQPIKQFVQPQKPQPQQQPAPVRVAQQPQSVKVQSQKIVQPVVQPAKTIQPPKPVTQVKIVQQQAPQQQIRSQVQAKTTTVNQQTKTAAPTPNQVQQQLQKQQQLQQKQQQQKPLIQSQKVPAKPQIDLLPPFSSAERTSVSAEKLPLLANRNKVVSAPKLAIDLLPPFENSLLTPEVTSTQGPPIYFEWKVPSSGLEPPKFDNETSGVQTNSVGPSRRSVQGEANLGENRFQEPQRKASAVKSSIVAFPYKNLQKKFAIPDFEFPIESTGREGYNNQQAINSFLVKIPPAKGPNQDRYYFLENPKCPSDCHPQYFKPGTCEPCVKIR
jgi:hypothetical protein